MSYTYFDDPIECPECGHHTGELCQATSRHSGESVLMCEGCYADSEEGLEEWNDKWETRDDEFTGDFLM